MQSGINPRCLSEATWPFDQLSNFASGKSFPGLSSGMAAKSPLLVWLIFHPQSDSARSLAREIHRQLNDDVVVPGLRIPTAFCPVGNSDQPPPRLRLDFAERNLVVPLADEYLAADEAWCSFIADVWENSQNHAVRCVPIQLSNHAWPLDLRLNEISFARAYLEPEGLTRTKFVVRRIVVELCRYLSGLQTGDDKSNAPITLFLSHAKADVDREPKVTEKLIDALGKNQPIDAWVDSGNIPTGSKFAEEIERGVRNSSLLVVLTDNYSSREFCREEIFLAKEHHRPIAIIDALTGFEVRAFPYGGNVPCVRWDGDPQIGIDLLLKETLRHLHTSAVIEASKQSGDVLSSRTPELLTLVALKPGSTVLYPDPPLGAGEARRLAGTRINIVTPLQRLALDQTLRGRVVALSMSESTDSRQFPDGVHLEDNMLELSRYLLIKGATLAYGGNLGAEGYTLKLFELVRMHNALSGVPAFDRVVNHLGWPLPRLSVNKRAELRSVAQTIELPRPEGIDETLHQDFVENPAYFPADKSALHRFAWARGMSAMREFQADVLRSKIVARVVLGGSFGPSPGGKPVSNWYAGRVPGVLEEIMLSVKAEQPIFLVGAYGGVARLVIDLLQGKEREEATWAYQQRAPHAAEMRDIYNQRGLEWLDYPEMISILRRKGIAGMNPLLTTVEHEMLFETVDPRQIVELVLTGLGRIR